MMHRTAMTAHLEELRTITERLVSLGHPRPRAAVLCEYSGAMASALHSCGIDTVSCDIEYETKCPAIPHFRGDALQLLEVGAFELICAFPPCTFLSNAQTRYLVTDPRRWARMEEAAELMQCSVVV